MNAGSEILLFRDTAQQPRELLAFTRRQRCAESVVVRARDAPDLGHRLHPFLRNVQRVESPIFRIVSPLHETAFPKLVEPRHEPARHHPEQRGKSLLTDSGVRWNEIELAKALGEPCCGMRAHLSQEKCRRARASRPTCDVVSFFHTFTIARRNGLR